MSSKSVACQTRYFFKINSEYRGASVDVSDPCLRLFTSVCVVVGNCRQQTFSMPEQADISLE